MPFRQLLVFALFCCGLAVQASEIEDLSARLQTASGKSRVDILNELAKSNWGISARETRRFANQARELAVVVEYPAGEAAALRNVGISYWYEDKYDLALENTLRALRLYEDIGDEQGIAASLSTVGTVYLNLDRFERAMQTYETALELAERMGDQNRVGILLSNLGTTAIGMERPGHALEYFERALVLLQENGSQLDVLTALGNIASAQRRLGRFDEALAVNAEIIGIATEIDSRIRLGDAHTDTADILISLGRYDAARQNLDYAIDLARRENLKRIEHEAEFQLSRLLEKQGNYREALEHLRRHDTLRKNIFDERLAETTAQLQQKYESEKREAEIQSNELQLEIERSTRNFFVVLSALVLFLALSFFLLYRSKRRQNVMLKKVAGSDPLTGLSNRRAMLEALERENDFIGRGDSPPSIALIDVDHFKSVNDRFGHAEGDRVLTRVAHCIRESVREDDMVARWGGEEFLVLMPSCSIDDAVRSAERIRQRLTGLNLLGVGDRGAITVTIGVSELQESESIGAFIKRADMALYRGKSAGRNTVERAEIPVALS